MAPASSKRSASSEPDRLVGCEKPRLFTEPARRLTRKTTLGFEAIQFAEEMLGVTLLPWQRHWLRAALEVNPDGSFRYRTVLTLVARQSGKTHLLKCLALYFMYLRGVRLVLGSAQSLDIARESWQGAVDMAEADRELRAEIEAIRRVNGEQELRLASGARYRISASTRSAGRGLSVDLLVLDELREHRSWDAWGALSKTTIARPNALTVAISNAGDDQSIVLNNLRAAALSGNDPTLGIFEWSAPEGCDLDDRQAWAQANPGLGHTISERAIAAAMATDPPAVFRTEVLCQRVDAMDSAVDLGAWRSGVDPAGTMGDLRDRVVVCLDVAPDSAHVSLVAAAAADDNRVRLDVVAAWNSTEQARNELEEILDRVGARAEAWFPTGPAAALAPIMRARKNAVEVKGAMVTEACQAFADLVASGRILHPGDPLLDAHVGGASKLPSGDGWRFTRRGVGHCDAAYAAAGAVHTALTLPVETLPEAWIV